MQPLNARVNFSTASSTWDEEELEAINEVVKSGRFTMGEKTEQFEKAYAEYIGSRYCVAVNSGSSANLLMVAAYTLLNGPGTVIVPSIAWATSYSPFQQYGWKLKFVDIDKETLNYDTDQLNAAHQDGDLILAVNLLGNPNEFDLFPDENILEDNCESMGAEYYGQRTGTFGLMSSHSTYFSHHICTMEGGLITTDDRFLYEMLVSIRSHGWTRHFKRDNAHGVMPGKFNFIYPGYNVRPTEIQSALGLVQLKKLPEFVRVRRENHASFIKYANKRGWKTQREPYGGKSSSFGCALFTETPEELSFLTESFDEKGIEHRPIMTGNFTKSPSIKYYDHTVHGALENADWVESHGIFVGNHHFQVDWGILD